MTPDRFFTLVLALQSRPATTTQALAEEVGVSSRTIARDLAWLADAGFPVLARQGRNGGVQLLPGGALDATRLTPDEREQLSLAGLDTDQRARLGVEGAADRALRKVHPTRPADARVPLSSLVHSDNRPWFGRDPGGATPAGLIGDLRAGRCLSISYRRAGQEPRRRTVDPYGLLAKGGRWYLVADADGEPRLFALQRLTAWRVLPGARRLRAGETLQTVADHLTSAWESSGEREMDVRIGSRQVERAVRILGTRLTVGERDDAGNVRARFRYSHLEDVRFLLSFATDLTVVHPPEARRRLAELAREIADHYAE